MVGVPKDLKMRADFVVCVGVEAVQKVECRVRAWHRFPRDETESSLHCSYGNVSNQICRSQSIHVNTLNWMISRVLLKRMVGTAIWRVLFYVQSVVPIFYPTCCIHSTCPREGNYESVFVVHYRDNGTLMYLPVPRIRLIRGCFQLMSNFKHVSMASVYLSSVLESWRQKWGGGCPCMRVLMLPRVPVRWPQNKSR